VGRSSKHYKIEENQIEEDTKKTGYIVAPKVKGFVGKDAFGVGIVV
jgi:hypothetical protein